MLFVRSIHLFVIIRGHRSDDGRQHRHRMCVVAKSLKKTQHAFVQHGVTANGCVELVEFFCGRQLTVQQQVRDFDKAGIVGKLFDRVTPIHQNAFLAIDERNIRFAATSRYESGVVSKYALLTIQLGYVDYIGSDRTASNW